jgi:uncharacterized membrane-anchored protein
MSREDIERLHKSLQKNNDTIRKLAEQLGLKGIDQEPKDTVVEKAIEKWVEDQMKDKPKNKQSKDN